MTRLLGTVSALIAPANRVIIVAGPAAEFIPFPEGDRLVATGPDIIYLISASGRLHDAAVTLEAWDARPQGEVDALDEVELSDGTLWISRMLEGAASEPLRTGPAGRYGVGVRVTGRAELLRLEREPGRPEAPHGVERFVVRLWPSA